MTRSSKIDVVGVGLNATDTLIPVAHYPPRGSKIEFRSAKVLPGGQVATAMIACQLWGLRARYVGKVGDDIAAELHRSEFTRLGVEAHLFSAPGCPSQQAFILVDDGGERTVLWKRDDRLTLRPEELDRNWIISSRALHVDGHDTAAAAAAAGWARAAGVPVIADLDEPYPGVEELNVGTAPRTVRVSTGDVEFDARLRIDTPGEADYYRHGGIMQFVLRSLL